MKATIEFNLDNLYDEIAYKRAVKAEDMAGVLFEITNNLRKKCINKHEDSSEAIDYVFEEIAGILDTYSVTVDSLIS